MPAIHSAQELSATASTMVDAVALNSCAEWIAGISCSEQSWLDDCDLAVECD